jgi:hypothetical protein
MSDPRQSDVWGKKPVVADRTTNERKYCKPCDYYYSEMYTCPICYGEARAVERIIELLEAGRRDSNPLDDVYDGVMYGFIKRAEFKKRLIALIKGENK